MVFDLGSYPVCSSNMTGTTLDDEAGTPITSGFAPWSGSFLPTQPLSVFDGEDAAGVWTLTIEDDTLGDSGSLVSWSLVLSQ